MLRINRSAILAASAFLAIGIGLFAIGCGKKADGNKAPRKSEAAEKQAPPSPSERGGDTLIVTARLIEIPGSLPPNDLYNYVYIMKYRVIKVEKGAFNDAEILVGIYNPLIPRKQIRDAMRKNAEGDVGAFTAGDTHRLMLVTPIDRAWKDQVEDDYIDSDQPKYYALKADVAN